MTEVSRIARLLEQTFEGQPYYGPSVLAALGNVTADVAVRRPDAAGHTIWELAVHLTAELTYAVSMIEGTAGPWVEGETTWPAIADTSDASWQRAINNLTQANRRLVEVVNTLDDAILSQTAVPVGVPFYSVLHGTIQHGVYHAGQVSLLKRQVTDGSAQQMA